MIYNNIALSLLVTEISMTSFAPLKKTKPKKLFNSNQN